MTLIELTGAEAPIAPIPGLSSPPEAPSTAAVVRDGQVLIFCDGGLANRISSLVGGMVLAERLGRPFTILWPRNNRCGAAFEDLFDMPDPVAEVRLQDLVPFEQRLQLWLHENDVGFTGPVKVLRKLAAPQAQATLDSADGRAILYCENSVLGWLPDADVQRAYLRLRLRAEIIQRAMDLIGREAPDGHIGIHLRGTDFGVAPPVEAMLEAVKANPGKRFFVCSDEPDIEARFALEPNVFLHRKTAYVDRLTTGPWRQAVRDSDGLPYGSNIDRTGRSVVDACVDLLLLATSTPVQTSRSTFLALAIKLRTTGWVERQIRQAPSRHTISA